ncbi:TonB system transport protein TonB [Klebsiella quasipneumoniae]|uniref:TonB system transport protein TonB n=1 Tax=Klebsiella quasipneumoniae TaxID=1463165 RepID=UPI001F4EBE13|nr:TonB system transport protein TonB [Klebsiella quasipneumoniae]MCH9290516.1 TonB system transport protein TonB [Klebsiella quasipneumoniae]
MSAMTLDLPRRFPWPTLLSVAIHGAVVAGLLYTSVHQVIEQPSPTQPIEITMVAPADLEPPPAAQPVVQPVVEPEPEPEPEVVPEPPKEAPVVIHKPEPKPKPKPKPKPRPEKKVEQPKRDVKPAAEPRPASPFENNNTTPARTAPSTSSAAAKPTVTAPSGPRAISRVQPTYPARAQALRIEGTVRVKFDVTADGRIDNLQILSAQPANMFEREVKSAMRRWRYEQARPGTGVTMTIKFRLNGVEIN